MPFARTSPRPRSTPIPPLGRRTAEIAYDANAYGLRHCVECFINKIKHYRRIATRFAKTASSFFSMLCLAAAMIWLR
jgi:transposase